VRRIGVDDGIDGIDGRGGFGGVTLLSLPRWFLLGFHKAVIIVVVVIVVLL